MRVLEINQPRVPIVFLDMDGVLCDFFSEITKFASITANSNGKFDYHDVPRNQMEASITQIAGTDFFSKLPKFPTTDQLVALTVKQFGSYSICSAPLRGDFDNCATNKTLWIRRNLNPQPAQILITRHKEKAAVQPNNTPNILVDDRSKNIAAWRAAGGIGIKYQADEDTLDIVVRGFAAAKAAIL